MKTLHWLAPLALSLGTAQGVIPFVDRGTTAPTGFATGNTVFDAGNSGAPKVFGFRKNNTHGQTFTIPNPGISLEKIYVGYGSLTGAATATTITLTVDAGNNGSNEISDTFSLVPASITQQSAPYSGIHWLELDLSAYNLTLVAGVHSFRLTATAMTPDPAVAPFPWLLAPSYGFNNPYPDGANTGQVAIGNPLLFPDANFAVSGGAPDSDNDDLPDPWEISFAGITGLTDLNGTLPAGSGPGAGTGDFDGDGLSDLDEFTNDANPTLTNTDNDGIGDAQELGGLLNPYTGLVLGSLPGNPTDPADPDSDNDGILDGEEVGAGLDGFVTNPNQDDTDSDFMLDRYEVTNNLLGGLSPVSAADGAAGQDLDGDTLDNFDEFNAIPQTRADKADTDGDDYSDRVETNSNSWFDVFDTGSDPVDSDSDDDGLSDGDENLDLVASNPPIQYDTDPNVFDTDGDFYGDGTEALAGSEPGNAASTPTGVAFRETGFANNIGWTNRGGTTLSTANELLAGSGQYAVIDMAAFENGLVLPYPNPSATVYCSVDFRIAGTFGGGTAVANFNSGAKNAVSSDGTVHCIVRLESNGSIVAFDGTLFNAVVPAGGIVSGTPYTVQIDHNIPGQTYAVRVYNRALGSLIGSIAGVSTRPTSIPTADPLFFAVGSQAPTSAWDLAVDNMKVSLFPVIVPVSVLPKITGTAFNNAQELVIDFTGAPARNFEVTKSLNLQPPFAPLGTPLIVSTNASGVGQAIVPASEATTPAAFFRMEER